MIPYNTDLKPVILPEFGRNVQSMIEHCMHIADREERNRCAYAIADVMANLFPNLVSPDGNRSQIWDQMNIISGFTLDVDFPCEVITRDRFRPKPAKIPYTASSMRYRHYGKSIEKMIEKVSEIDGDGDQKQEKDLLISMIAHHMKKLMLIHNKEGVDDGKILRDLREYSQGQIDLDPQTYLLHEYKEAEVQKPTGRGRRKKK